MKKHARKHLSQQLRRDPLLPFHYVVHDPMHGVHNEVNVLLDEAVHKHLMVDSTDPAVTEVIERVTQQINKRWKDAGLSKFIQFGRDGKGAHSHALDGPAFKDMMRAPQLIIDTIETMKEVYSLLESKDLTPPLKTSATGVGADRGPAATKGKRGKGKAAAPKAKAAPKKQKKRGVNWGDAPCPSCEEVKKTAPELAAERNRGVN